MSDFVLSPESYNSCHSILCESSQESNIDTLQDTLNEKIFLIDMYSTNIWFSSQNNETKILNIRERSMDSSGTLAGWEPISSVLNSEDKINKILEISDSTIPSIKLADIIKQKLHLSESRSSSQSDYGTPKDIIIDEDANFLSELVEELTKCSFLPEVSESLTQEEIDGIKDILSQEYPI
ncbi:hypothetical protein cand_009100 [Cryptosporidium andersoni]|uniref:Uncharacterized protein n=1 Tax=Cryptosporidium andersoni TaxID=117008 RepID=A0A1J4MVH4_9CRYT|nr:hypothetical protein cand_009100 [Cryptosporidium andersoni]